jgi:hypothetical protein
MKILAIDPGKLSGIAWTDTDSYLPTDPGNSFLGTDEWTWEQFVETIPTFVGWTDEVVCESYHITNETLRKSRGENWSIELIGLTKAECFRAGRLFTLQPPSMAKSFATDEKLKKIGWYSPGRDHRRDATRHLVIYCLRKGYLSPEQLGLTERTDIGAS